jgi:tetratricopeptide (TPR) repeat protein
VLCLVIASSVLPSLASNRADDALAASASRDPATLKNGAEDAAAADRLNPLSVEPLLTGAAIAESRGQYSRAGDLLTKAAKRQPDNPEPWLGLARLELIVGNRPAANRAAVEAFRMDRFNEAAFFLYLGSRVDERSSASATGTPLPEKLPTPAAPKPAAKPTAPPAQQPVTPQAPATPTPTPTPTPAPQPTPQPPPQKFRSTG